MKLSTTLLCGILIMFNSCNGQNQEAAESQSLHSFGFAVGQPVPALGQHIDCIFQDKNDNYWFASNGEGVYRYDGKTILHITTKDGLCSDFVWSVQEDINGNIWFATRDGICNFDGRMFTNYTNAIKNAPYGKLIYKQGGLFFNHLNGICFYDGKSFTNFVIHPADYTPPVNNTYRPYGVYCTLADRSGKVWFGTQEKGVCVYDGSSFSFINGEDLDGPAVRCLFQDKAGTTWFGNNGGGLYRYDGKTLRNITEEEKLTNYTFLKEHKYADMTGTMARVFAINGDDNGNIWIGTVDAGVWKYDGTHLTNYTVKDGLSGNSVNVIYKDRKGKLWFVSNGNAVCNFDGQKFVKAGL